MPTPTFLDYILLAGLALGIWRGSRSGALRQVAGLVAIVVAFWLGLLLMRPLGMVITQLTALPQELGPVIGFIAVASIIVIGVGVATFAARQTLAIMRLGVLDAGAGAVLGGLRAAIVLSLFLLMTSAVAFSSDHDRLFPREAREASILYEPLRAVVPMLWQGLKTISPGLQDRLADHFVPDDERSSDGQ